MTKDETRAILPLSLLTVLAFLVRILNWPQVFVDGRVRFVGADTLYHMRRVFVALSNGLRLPAHDAYMNFPEGFHCNWPLLFDLFLARVALVVGGGNPSPWLVETVGAVVPPVLGALTVIPVFLIAKSYLGLGTAVLAAAFFALMPYPVQVSVLGRPDHHVAVALLSSMLFLVTLYTVNGRTRDALIGALLCGILLVLSIGVWVGSILFVGILAATFVLALACRRRHCEHMDRLAVAGGLLFLAAALCIWPIASRSHWARTGLLTWDALSLFHVYLLLLCAAGVVGLRVFLGTLPAAGSPGTARSRARPWIPLLGLTLACVALLKCMGGLDLVRGGLGWFAKKDPVMRHLVESAPLSWQAAQENFSRLVLLYPLLIGLFLRQALKTHGPEKAVLFGVWTLLTGLSAVTQERFSDVFSVSAAILNAYVFALLLPGLWSIIGGRRRLRKVGTVTAAGVVACLVLWPTAKWLRFYANSAPRFSRHAVYEMCEWLRDQTETDAGYTLGQVKPEYSVLADWSLGNAIVYIGQHANVANNFVGWDENRDANLAPCSFFVSSDLTEAESILDRHSVRYVVVSDVITTGYFGRMLDILGLDHAEFFTRHDAASWPTYSPTARTLGSMALRLYLFDADGLDHFQLAYTSTATRAAVGKDMPVYKIFRYGKP